MKEILRKKLGRYTPGREEWHIYVLDCLGAEICPKCGNDLFIFEKPIDKGPGEPTKYGCPNCDWQDYL